MAAGAWHMEGERLAGSSTAIMGCRAKEDVSRAVRRAGSPKRTGGPLARLQRTISQYSCSVEATEHDTPFAAAPCELHVT